MNHLKPFGMALTLVLLLPSLGLLAASGQTAPETPPSIDRPSAGTQADSVPGEIVVGLEQPDPQFDKEVRGKGGKVLDKIESLKALLIKVPVNAEDAFIKAIKNNPNVLYAERNSVIRAVGTPNDSYWSYQWNQRQIKANDAWDTEPGDLSVIVAVVDSGVKYSHPDLSGRVINGYDFINDDNDAIDDDGHGTHVAGIVGAKTNNARGVAGTGELSILAVKVLDSSGSGSNWSVSEGIKYAADYGADIINLSLGCYCTSTLMEDATNYAYNTKGKLLVGSAGNDDTNAAHYPSSYPTVISVASTNNKDNKANHSNWGADIELSAPGGDKGGGPYTKTYVLSTWKDNNYAFAYGTSMASPHVAGVGGLILSKYPSLTNQQLRDHLKYTSDDLGAAGWDQYFGFGRVNALTGVQTAPATGPDTTAPVISDVASSGVTSSSATVTWDTDEAADSVVNYGLTTALGSTESNVNLVLNHSITLNGLASETTYYFEVQSTDASTNTATDDNGTSYYSFTTLAEDTTPPAQVTGLVVTTAGSSQLDLSWNANSESDLDYYNIYRSEIQNFTPDGSNLITTSVTNSYSDTSLAASTTYYYKVSALDTSNNEGIVSDEAGGTTSAPTVDYMHVESIDFKQKGPRWLDIMVTIYDSSGSPVSGATVYMDITISGSVSSVTAVTNAEGIATHKISRPDPGTYSVVVTNVTHSDFVYAAGANKENDDNYTVTSKK